MKDMDGYVIGGVWEGYADNYACIKGLHHVEY